MRANTLPFVIPGERERFTRARGKGTQVVTVSTSRKHNSESFYSRAEVRNHLGPLPLATSGRSAGDDNFIWVKDRA
jgi:hypothetical protein